MPLGMFRNQHSPILADFGTTGVKFLQTSLGERPTATSAAFLAFPERVAALNPNERLEFVAAELPRVLKAGGFRGNRVVISPFSQHMLVQHVGVATSDVDRANDLVRAQLAGALGCDPHALVVRTRAVCDVVRDGQSRTETLAIAMAREDAMRYVELFRRVKIAVAGVHGEIPALVHAFDHVNRRLDDAGVSTMYVDLGYGTTKVSICHGAQLVFAKSIAVAGRTFDACLARSRGIGLALAHATRIDEGVLPARAVGTTPGTVESREGDRAPAGRSAAAAPRRLPVVAAVPAVAHPTIALSGDRRGVQGAPALGVDLVTGAARPRAPELQEPIDALADELGMCVRYHAALFRDRRIDRVVFLGGEARDVGLCQALAASLRLPAKAGDPMARFLQNGPAPAGLPEPSASHPGWSVACGLAFAPTDL